VLEVNNFMAVILLFPYLFGMVGCYKCMLKLELIVCACAQNRDTSLGKLF
jgi:hypothetical protein